VSSGVPFGRVRIVPSAWHLAPYIALWLLLGPRTGEIQYWVIVGDLPATSLGRCSRSASRAIASFAERWQGVRGGMLEGRKHPTIEIGQLESSAELGIFSGGEPISSLSSPG